MSNFRGRAQGAGLRPAKEQTAPAGREFEPKAHRPTPGSADLCFLTLAPLPQVQRHLAAGGVPVIESPVQSTGAQGPFFPSLSATRTRI